MNPTSLFQHAARGAALLFFACSTGCITLPPSREEAVEQEQQQLAERQTIARLRTQVETLLAQQDQTQQQMQQIRTLAQDRVTATDLERSNSQMQTRIAELERKIAALDAARAQDQQEIVAKLSKNMATAMAAQQKYTRSEPVRSSGGGTTKPSGSGKAYKHTVAAGDTLSAIAAAYKTSSGAIISANNLKDPSHLKVGQELLIPAP